MRKYIRRGEGEDGKGGRRVKRKLRNGVIGEKYSKRGRGGQNRARKDENDRKKRMKMMGKGRERNKINGRGEVEEARERYTIFKQD